MDTLTAEEREVLQKIQTMRREDWMHVIGIGIASMADRLGLTVEQMQGKDVGQYAITCMRFFLNREYYLQGDGTVPFE